MLITVDPAVLAVCPALTLGVIEAEVVVAKRNDVLWELLQSTATTASIELRRRELKDYPEIAAARDVYRKLGKDPGRYRGSAEALLRRISQGKGVYQVNNVVDANNLTSIRCRHPVGVYDLSRTARQVYFRVGVAGESYEGIGKDTINLEGLPLFADEAGPFGSPTSDSRRAMIELGSRDIAMVVIAFSGPAEMDSILAQARLLVERYAGGRVVNTTVVTEAA